MPPPNRVYPAIPYSLPDLGHNSNKYDQIVAGVRTRMQARRLIMMEAEKAIAAEESDDSYIMVDSDPENEMDLNEHYLYLGSSQILN